MTTKNIDQAFSENLHPREEWYEVFDKAKIPDANRHKKAFDMVVKNLLGEGIKCEAVINTNQDGILFVLDWNTDKVGLWLYPSKNKWEICPLHPSQERKGEWKTPYTFDEIMNFNFDWEDAYSWELEDFDS